MRKPLPSSKLKTLSDEVQRALFEYSQTHTLAKCVAWLQEFHGVSTNNSSLSEWRAWFAMLAKVDAWSFKADELAARLAKRGDVSPELVSRIAEAVFLSAASEENDVKAFATVAGIIQRDAESRFEQWKGGELVKLKREQIEIQRADLARKVKALEAQLSKAQKILDPDSKLTEAQKVEKMRSIFGR